MHPVALFALAVVIIGVGYLLVDKFLPSRRVTAASAVSVTQSIAVLPFVDLSEKHDQEYLGDGIAEEILNLLVNVPQLKVISRCKGKSRQAWCGRCRWK
jgi:adenylate cyclase